MLVAPGSRYRALHAVNRPIRLTAVMTHPVQYFAPWFRYLDACVPGVELTVLYAMLPSSTQQGAGFEQDFAWDVPVMDGYRSEVVQPTAEGACFDSDSYRGLNVRGIGDALLATRPDVALINGWQSVTLVRALRICRAHRIPVVYRGDSIGHQEAGTVRRIMSRLRARWMLRYFARYLVTGTNARAWLSGFAIPGSKLFDAPHCIDNAFFAERAAVYQGTEVRRVARRDLRIDPDAFVVLYAGKLTRIKRPTDIVSAVARLGGNVALLIAGSGPLEDECRVLAASEGVQLSAPGFMNQTELPRAYAIADCLALAGNETWGLVVNEAMASGLPCVLSDAVGCLPDMLVAGRTGEACHMGDVDGLAQALAKVREADRGARARMCREHVSRFSFEAASEGLVRACESALQ